MSAGSNPAGVATINVIDFFFVVLKDLDVTGWDLCEFEFWFLVEENTITRVAYIA